MSDTELLAWIDVETTGLDPHTNLLLEVACVVTDYDFNVVGQPFHSVIYIPEGTLKRYRRNAAPVVQDMHDATNLWERATRCEKAGGEALPLVQVDEQLLALLQSLEARPHKIRVGGNSIRLDLNFIEYFLPQTYKHLSFRMFDMSSISKFAEKVFGIPPMQKQFTHRALDDIHESIAEARYTKEQLIKAMSAPAITPAEEPAAASSWVPQPGHRGRPIEMVADMDPFVALDERVAALREQLLGL